VRSVVDLGLVLVEVVFITGGVVFKRGIIADIKSVSIPQRELGNWQYLLDTPLNMLLPSC
jgi:hypothetical protein